MLVDIFDLTRHLSRLQNIITVEFMWMHVYVLSDLMRVLVFKFSMFNVEHRLFFRHRCHAST